MEGMQVNMGTRCGGSGLEFSFLENAFDSTTSSFAKVWARCAKLREPTVSRFRRVTDGPVKESGTLVIVNEYRYQKNSAVYLANKM